MSKEHILNAVVPFADVDRNQVMLLPRLVKLLQEAAIEHAELFGVGARGLGERGTSWVLNRLAVQLTRYPRRDEALRVTTWSTGVHSFKGFREFRLHSGNELLLSGSSFWLWIDLRTRTLARVPEDIAASFPIGSGSPAFHPDLERLRLTPPAATAPATTLDLRYSDQDANDHINNTAYFDLLQTALLRSGGSPQPLRVEIQFQREIPIDATSVEVRLEPRDAGATAFSIANPTTSFALGLVS